MFFAEAIAKKTKRRYELREKLGEGGMGAVWRALDTALEVDVAMKLLLDVNDPNALRLFYEECDKQAALAHPNIVEIRDRGSLEDGTVRTPYIVMPLLRGSTLTSLIRTHALPLPVSRCLDIITQASRGLQAAHDAGLLHRDIKPSNLFILDDDSVKLLDFGVAHRLDVSRTVGRKGTLLYMSPEQLAMKALTRASDIFSLGVVCYEMLTKQHPFLASSEDKVAEAIRSLHPPAPDTLNGEVSVAVSQVVCKAMAKNPAHRFASMKEFSEALRRAQYDALYTVFEPSRFEPRLQKARSAFETGNLQFAQELTEELLSEGYLVDGLLALESEVKETVKQQSIERLMESARARMQDGEFRLALQRVSEVLDLEPRHNDALVLRHHIEASRAEADIVDWLTLGQQHLEKLSFRHARQAAQRVLELQPGEERALSLMALIERREHDVQRLREQKQAAYAAALEAEAHNELTTALSSMRVVLELEKQAPDTTQPSQLATYERLYHKLHAEHEAVAANYSEAKSALERGEYAVAMRLCEEFLTRMPQHTLFKALKFDTEQHWRRAISMQLLDMEHAIENEDDLGKRVERLEEAASDNPGVNEFARLLESNRQKRDLVAGIVHRARELEARELYAEALVQWETLETIHPAFPGLAFEIENLRLRRQLAERNEQRSLWLAEINRAADDGDLDESLRLLSHALKSMPEDAELLELHPYLRQQRDLAERAVQSLREGRAAMSDGQLVRGLDRLRAAYDLGSKVKSAKSELADGLLAAARASQDTPRQACVYLEELLTLEPGNHTANSFLRFLQEQTEQSDTDEALTQARQLRTAQDLAGAIQILEHAAARYPNNQRVRQLLHELDASRTERRGRDLDLLRRKRLEADTLVDQAKLYATAASADEIVARYEGDEEFQSESRLMRARLKTIAAVETPIAPAPPQPAKRIPWAVVAGLAVVVVCLVAVVVMLSRLPHRASPSRIVARAAAGAAAGSVSITVDPAGATIRDGDRVLGVASPTLTVPVSVGDQEFTAVLPGYTDATQPVHVAAGHEAKITFALAPSMEMLSVTGRGAVVIDAGRPFPVHGRVEDVPLIPGNHSLAWKGEDAQPTAAGSAAPVTAMLHVAVSRTGLAHVMDSGKMAGLAVVSSLGQQADVYAAPGSPITVDGKYRGVVRAAGLTLALPYGPHVVYAGTRSKGIALHVVSQPGRQFLVSFGGGESFAALTVLSSVDGASVKLMDGARLIRQGVTSGGRFDMADVPAGNYQLVATAGGSSTQVTQAVALKPHRQVSITLPFQVATGSIRVHAPAQTSILMDGNSAGKTADDGTLLIAKVGFGEHHLQASIHGSDVKQDVKIDADSKAATHDVTLQAPEQSSGILVPQPNPADAQVTVYGSNGEKIPSGSSQLTVSPGKYRVEASAPGYAERNVDVTVAAGQKLAVDLALTAASAPSGSVSAAGWNASDWTLDESAKTLTHTGTGVGLYAARPELGTYVFSATLNRVLLVSWQKVQWVIGYRDAHNYQLFTLSRDTLSYVTCTGDKKSVPQTFPVHSKGSYQVMVRVHPNEVSVSIRDGARWTQVHDWKPTTQGLADGGFGFKDSVTLTSFAYSR